MGTDDDAFCGCLPWGRRRGSSAGTNRRPASARKAVRPVSAAKPRGSNPKTTPEPPSNWRSQVGVSDASSTGSVQGRTGDSGNGAVYVSATAFSLDDVPATLAAGARTRSPTAASDIRFGSQPQVHVQRPSGSVSSTGNPPGNYPISKASGGGGSPLPRGDVAFADPDVPTAAGAAAPSGASGAAPALRLQELQERYRQRAVRGVSAANGNAAAPPGIAADDRFRSDQMQCDSFTYNSASPGRRSSYGNGPPRLGPLPPLPPSPGHPVAQVNGRGGYGHRQLHAHGYAQGQGQGHVQGISVSQQQRDSRMPEQAGQNTRWQKPPMLLTGSPDISRHNSLTTTHIPGSLPSVTQSQVSPGLKRIHPPAAPAWDEAPMAAGPAGAEAAEAPPPTAPLLTSPPRPTQGSWADAEAAEAVGRSSSPAAAACSTAAQLRQAEQEQQLRAAAGGGGRCEAEAFSFSPAGTPSRGGHPVSRLGGGGDGGGAAGAVKGVGSPALRPSYNGGVAHRTTHGPVGYSSAAAAALPGFALGGRQLSKQPSGGPSLRAGFDRVTNTVSLAAESIARESGDFLRDSSVSQLHARPVASDCIGGGGGGGGGGGIGLDRPRGGGGGGGRISLQLYDSFAPGAVLAKPPSFGGASEHRSTPGCIAAGPWPSAQEALDEPRTSSQAQPPQHQPSQRLSQPGDGAWVAAPRSAPIEPVSSRKAFAGGPASLGSFGVGAGDVKAEPATQQQPPRPAARPSQQRMQAARANEEMLMALLGSSKRTLDLGSIGGVGGGGTAAELERFDRVQDAMSRLDELLAAPQPPPPPPVAAPARPVNARAGHLEDAAYDFTGATPPSPNRALGVKPW